MTLHPPCRVYVFAGFRLDARRRLLLSRSDGQPVALPTTSFDALLYLVEHAGELVEKPALMQAVWPHVNVEENSLSQSISALRRALSEAPSEHRFVVTVPGRGYRFIAEVATDDTDGARAETAIASSDPNAFQLYVTGWWALTRPGVGNLEGALQHLEQATARDPNFALAHACIASCYVMLGIHGLRPPHEVFPNARAAVLRALEIDADLAEAHAELSEIHTLYDFDTKRAQAALRRAFEINPRSFQAHRYHGLQLLARGEFDLALAALRRAQSIEPLAVHVNGNIGMVLYFQRRYAEAITQCEMTLKLDGSFDVPRSVLGRSLLRLGEFDRAIQEFEARTAKTPNAAADLAAAYALSGRTGEAKAALEELLRRSEHRYVSPFDVAMVYAAFGDDDGVLDWLERAIEQRAYNFVKVDPLYHRLHGTPRFTRLLKEFGVE
jgi:DNA-binding winged helix-turn-helix (wHTH) protein/Tfp pilus assembly protein PilF